MSASTVELIVVGLIVAAAAAGLWHLLRRDPCAGCSLSEQCGASERRRRRRRLGKRGGDCAPKN